MDASGHRQPQAPPSENCEIPPNANIVATDNNVNGGGGRGQYNNPEVFFIKTLKFLRLHMKDLSFFRKFEVS